MSDRKPKKTDLMSEEERNASSQKVGAGFWTRVCARRVLRRKDVLV